MSISNCFTGPKEKLNPEEYKNYCRAIFRFKNIKFMRFRYIYLFRKFN